MSDEFNEDSVRSLRHRISGHWVEISVVLAIVVFFGLVIWGNTQAVLQSIRNFDWWMLGAVCVVTTIGLLFRFVKWEYFLRRLGIEIPLTTSLLVFFAGLLMILAPMKGAGVWRGWLLRDTDGIPISRIVPVVVAERTTDVLALAGLGSLGFVLYNRSVIVVVGIVSAFIGAILLVHWRWFCLKALGWIRLIPLVGKFADEFETVYEDTYELFGLRSLSVTVLLSLFAWTIEGVAIWLVLRGFGIKSAPVMSLFIFSVGSLVGGVTLLPGGLATTEASMAGLLLAFGFHPSIAASTTIIVRVGTLWYGVLLGLVTYLMFNFWRTNRPT